MELANRKSTSDERLHHIERGDLSHDIGKIGILHRILPKPSQLSEEEWIEMRKHPIIDYWKGETLECSNTLLRLFSIINSWDGSDYPSGLRGNVIPLESRIFAVADAFDAMTSDRPYLVAMPIREACGEIKRCAGTQCDAEIFTAFLNIGEQAWVKPTEIALKKAYRTLFDPFSQMMTQKG